MVVFVNLPTGRLVVIRDASDAPSLRSALRRVTGIPEEEMGLRRGGRVVRDDARIEDGTTLELALALRGGGKCAVEECKKRAALVVGDCRYCNGHYCAEHRLPEDHHCANIQACKQSSFQRNQDKLLQEKCVSSRV